MALPVLTIEQIRQAEAQADQNGYPYARMMEDAGAAAAQLAAEIIQRHVPDSPRITLLIGSGSNGGDGLVAARQLRQMLPTAQVRCLMLSARENDPLVEQAQANGVFFANATDDRDGRVIRQMVASADVVIDALFGIGVRLPIREAAQKLLRFARQALNERAAARRPRPYNDPTLPGQIERAPRQYVIAIDCPSGLDCDSGAIDKYALRADYTISFIAAKPGLLTFPGAAHVGQLVIAPLDMPDNLPALRTPTITLLDHDSVQRMMPVRPLDGHKGTFGRSLLIAGSDDMPGAAHLAARAAYRAGAGWVAVASSPRAINTLQATLPEAVWYPLADRQPASPLQTLIPTLDAVLIGPGIGQSAYAGQLLGDVLKLLAQADTGCACVLDADALNLWAEQPARTPLPPNTIITPHPGEMARLSGLSTVEVQANRLALVQEKAQTWGCIIVLKGAHTLIAAPNGKVAIAPFKTDALAKAGTGDTLAGIITALRGQGVAPYEAACAGVYLHGIAGLLAAQRIGSSAGVTATDVVEAIPLAWSRLTEGV